MKFDNIFTKAVKAGINDYIYKIADSMGNDTNFTDDNDALIVLEGKLDIRPVIITTGTVPVSAPAIVENGVCTVFPTSNMMRTIGASGKTVIIDASVTGADTVNVWERGVSALSAASSVRFATANGSAEFESSVLTSGGDVSVSVGTAQPNAVQKRALGEKLDSCLLYTSRCV